MSIDPQYAGSVGVAWVEARDQIIEVTDADGFGALNRCTEELRDALDGYAAQIAEAIQRLEHHHGDSTMMIDIELAEQLFIVATHCALATAGLKVVSTAIDHASLPRTETQEQEHE